MIQLLELGRVPEEPVKSSENCKVKPEIDGTAAVITGARARILLDKKVVARIVRCKGERKTEYLMDILRKVVQVLLVMK